MSPRLIDAERFRALRDFLHEWGFDEEGLAEAPGPDAPRGLLARLFLQKLPESFERAQALLGADGLALLEASGLVAIDNAEVGARFLLYPFRGLHIASDFPGSDAPEDFVFPAISQQTWEFLSILLETPCDSLLEIGAGSGAAALTAARYSRRVLAGDISPRCIAFAEFNRRLNGLDNVEIRQSDLFEAFRSETFDRIIAHPPYVPWTGKQDAYRHGGPDGEGLLRRLLVDLDKYLRPGGRFLAATMVLETADAGVEYRVREMLGDSADNFDILAVEREQLTPLEFILPWQESGELTLDDAWRLSEVFNHLKAKALVRCSLVIARHAEPAEPRTIRRKAGRLTDAVAIEEALAGPRADGWPSWDELLDRPLELSPGVMLETASEAGDGEWAPRRHILDAQSPFAFRSDCPPWAAALFPRLDGRRPLRDLIADLAIDPDEGEAFLGCLLSAGVIS